ncbi:MAG TPA: hypothetical protein VGJ11_02125 [Gaiellales bacterium]|jgi:hypothetical protein
MRPARLAILPCVAALLLSSCTGSGQATRPFGPGTLLSEARAAASGEHSARFAVVIQGKLLHHHALPAGMSAGPYGLALRGAVTGDGGGRADVHLDLREPGATISLEMREIGTKLYVEEPGGHWYSQQLGGIATSPSPGSDRSSRLADRFLEHDGDWLIDVGARRAGRKDVIAGDLDLGAIARDLVTLLRQAHAPRQDAGLVRYVIGSLDNTSWTLTFDHRSHLIEGLRARAEMRFQSDLLQKYGVAEPFGLPRAVTGLTITLAAHITHWGTSVHVVAPALSTPLPDPGLLRSAV